MRKWIKNLIPVIMIFILVSYGFTTIESTFGNRVVVPKALIVNEPTLVLYPNYKTVIANVLTTKTVNPPFLGKGYVGFKEALAFKESQGDYFTTNTLGYMGKYQFGVTTLELMGVTNTEHFKQNPILQEKIFSINLSRNKWILRKDIKRYVGQTMGFQLITESGILAAAHLAGAGNVKRFLRTNGKANTKDAFGANIANYMKKFGGYDVSFIKAIKNARL